MLLREERNKNRLTRFYSFSSSLKDFFFLIVRLSEGNGRVCLRKKKNLIDVDSLRIKIYGVCKYVKRQTICELKNSESNENWFCMWHSEKERRR